MPIIRVKPTKDGYRSGGPWTLVGSDWLAAIENADGSAYHTANSVTRNSLSLTGAKTFDFSQIPDDAVINAIRGIAIFRWVTGTGYSNITARLERGSAAGVISDIVTQDGGTGAWIELATPWATPTIPEHATGADIKASNERLSTELIMNWRMTNGGNKLQSFDVDQLAIDVDYTVAVTPDRFGTGSVSSTSVTTYSASKSTSGSAATNNSTSAASTAGKGVSRAAVVGATQSVTSDYVSALMTIAEGFGDVTGVGGSISVGGKSAVRDGLTTSNQSVTAAGNIQLTGGGIVTATQTADATDGTKASSASGDISATQTVGATYNAMATGAGSGDISSTSASIAIGHRGTSTDANSIVGSSASATALAQRASSSEASATQAVSSSGIRVVGVSGDISSVSGVVSGYSVQRSNQGLSSNVADVYADGFLQLDTMVAGNGYATVAASVTSTYGPPQRRGSSAITAADNVSAIGAKKAGNGAAIVSVSGISVSLYSTKRSGAAYVSGSDDVNSAHTRLTPFKIAENYSIHIINKTSAHIKETPVDGQHTLGGDFSHHVSGRR